MNKHGKFIVIDGGEGTGTTTVAKFLAEKFNGRYTREPGGTEFSERVRELILKSEYAGSLDAITQLFMMFGARHDHVRKVIEPALQKEMHVFSDRLDSSTFAYQVAHDEEKLRDLFLRSREAALGDCKPDLYIFLDVAPKIGLERVEKRGEKKDHFEEKEIAFHERVREAYQRFASMGIARCEIVDAAAPLEQVKAQVEEIVKGIM